MDGQSCDRCPQHSVARLELTATGGRLYFCAHHLRRYFPETGLYTGVHIAYPVTRED
jgi:hypothetical protein